MKIKLTIPKQFETHFNMDSFKDSLKRIAFDIKEYIKLKDSNPDVIPLSGLYEKELADALPHMFENAEIDYSEVEIDELRKSVKKRLNQAYPWTEPYKVENEPGTDHTLIDATPEAM